jgi:hypothetical protein
MTVTAELNSVRWYRPAVQAAVIAVRNERLRWWLPRLSEAQAERWLSGNPLLFNANNPLWYDAAVTAVCTLLNGGTIKIYQGSQPALNGSVTGTLLATLTFSSPAFGASSGGTATANAITNGTAGNTGTAQFFALAESGGTVVGTGTCGATSGFDLNLNSTSVTAGAAVSCSGFTVTG